MPRNKLYTFPQGRIYNKIVISSGLLCFVMGISILFLGLTSIYSVNFIQGVSVQAFWMGIIFFFTLCSWIAYAKLSIKTIRMLPFFQILLMFLLIRLIVSFIQGLEAHIESHSNIFNIFLIANLVLASGLFALEIVEWVGFNWLIYFCRAQLFLPEYPNSAHRKFYNKVMFWIKQAILIICFILFFNICNSIPPSQSLYIKVQNGAVAYSTDQIIAFKNIKFNQS